MSNATVKTYKPKPVETWEDIEIKIESEMAYLMYDGMSKEKARTKATEYVYEKYADVVERLKRNG